MLRAPYFIVSKPLSYQTVSKMWRVPTKSKLREFDASLSIKQPANQVKLRVKMLSKVVKAIAQTPKNCYRLQRFAAFSSSKSSNASFEVKINHQNETLELHDTEVTSPLDSERQKKFEFPFVYLRDNCQVKFASSSFSFFQIIIHRTHIIFKSYMNLRRRA